MNSEAIEGTSVFLSTERGVFHCRLYGESDAALKARGAVEADLPPVLICVHGAGMSSASFGPCAHLVAEARAVDEHPFAFRVVSIDMRCHGLSNVDGGESILTLDTLVQDFVAMVLALQAHQFPTIKRFYYAGHSLGGSVVSFGATEKSIAHLLGGVAMLDIVEGIAKLSLKYMDAVLQKRPTLFKSCKEAAHWFVAHGGMFNEEIAQLTVPFLLKESARNTETEAQPPLTWKTDLFKTAPCWDTWFEGLDKKFVSLPCPKMLLLATTDRLDKELTMAQMQGKFQLEIIGTQGHYVMEDQPAVVAVKLMRFVYRVETLTRKLPTFNSSKSH